MKTIRNVNKTGMSLSLIVFIFGCINAWAIVPYPLSPEIQNAEKVQAEKQQVLKLIKDLKKQDINFIKELINELEQMDAEDSNSLSKDETRAERH